MMFKSCIDVRNGGEQDAIFEIAGLHLGVKLNNKRNFREEKKWMREASKKRDGDVGRCRNEN